MPRGRLPDGLARFLAAARPAVVSTLGPGGEPATAAVWYLFTDGRLLLSMDAAGPRCRNLRADDRIALTVLADDWYNHVSLLGRAVELRDDPDFVDVDRLSLHYRGTPYEPRDWSPVTAIVEIQRWHTYGDPAAQSAPAGETR